MHLTTQQHMGLQLHQHYIDTHMDPSCGLHKATNHILYWIGTTKTMVPKKIEKGGKTGSPCLDKPVSGQGGKCLHVLVYPRAHRPLEPSSGSSHGAEVLELGPNASPTPPHSQSFLPQVQPQRTRAINGAPRGSSLGGS